MAAWNFRRLFDNNGLVGQNNASQSDLDEELLYLYNTGLCTKYEEVRGIIITSGPEPWSIYADKTNNDNAELIIEAPGPTGKKKSITVRKVPRYVVNDEGVSGKYIGT